MRKILYILIIFIISISVTAQECNIKTLKPKAFQEKINTLEDALILDCSTIEGFQKGHIEGAILIATSEMMTSILKDTTKDTPLLVYCKYGERSKKAIKKIKALGFKKIYQLKKGLSAWKRKGLPITKY